MKHQNLLLAFPLYYFQHGSWQRINRGKQSHFLPFSNGIFLCWVLGHQRIFLQNMKFELHGRKCVIGIQRWRWTFFFLLKRLIIFLHKIQKKISSMMISYFLEKSINHITQKKRKQQNIFDDSLGFPANTLRILKCSPTSF